MAKKKRISRKSRGRPGKVMAARQTPQSHAAMAKTAVSANTERSTSIINDLLGSFAEQTGANFG